MRRAYFFLGTCFVLFCFSFVGPLSTAQAAVTVSGDTTALPWNSSGANAVGISGTGSVEITEGDTLDTFVCYLGYLQTGEGTMLVTGSGSTFNASYGLAVGVHGIGTLNVMNGGVVNSGGCIHGGVNHIGTEDNATAVCVATVDGAGSQWNCESDLTVGGVDVNGTAMLNISTGGVVNVDGTTFVGTAEGSSCSINFGPNGGTLNTQILDAVSSQLTGTGTINAYTIAGDDNFVFDNTTGLVAQRTLNAQGQNVTVNMDLSDSAVMEDVVLYIGYKGTESMTFSEGLVSTAASYCLGQDEGDTGIVHVTSGAVLNGNVSVGGDGNATLDISDGGTVNSYSGTIGYGGSLDGSGEATIDGSESAWIISNGFHVGICGVATLNIVNQGTFETGYASLGKAYVSIDGQGSSWTCNDAVDMGTYADGTLFVTNGGLFVSAGSRSCLGYTSPDKAVALVDGDGSRWTCTSDMLYVGKDGTGVLNLACGGAVSAGSTTVKSDSLISVDIGNGSSMTVNGTLTNDGIVRATAGAIASTQGGSPYIPVTATSWEGTGTCQAIGGTWTTQHGFVVSEQIETSPTTSTSVDLVQIQRVLVVDSLTGQRFGAGFDPTSTATGGGSTIDFMASRTDTTVVNELIAFLGDNESILNSWNITSDLAAGSLALVSMEVNSNGEDMTVWRYDGTSWAEYELPDDSFVSYDGTYANFLIDQFTGSYAVSGTAVPEPSTFVLILAGLLALGIRPASKKN
jgi:T5SS/PEP-CTERM-associated repeat protein